MKSYLFLWLLPFSLMKCLLLFKHLLRLWGHKIIEWISSYKERCSCVPRLPRPSVPQRISFSCLFPCLFVFTALPPHLSPSHSQSGTNPWSFRVNSGHTVGSLPGWLHFPSLGWERHHHYALWSLIARRLVRYLPTKPAPTIHCLCPPTRDSSLDLCRQ